MKAANRVVSDDPVDSHFAELPQSARSSETASGVIRPVAPIHDAPTLAAARSGNVRLLRLRRRTRIGARIVIDVGGLLLPATIFDISETGAGLVSTAVIAPGDTVTLIFPDGSSKASTVRWRDGSRCGVALTSASNGGTIAQHSGKGSARHTGNTATSELAAPARAEGDSSARLSTMQKLSAVLRRTSARRTSDQKMLERACRKNGHAWLVDDDCWPTD